MIYAAFETNALQRARGVDGEFREVVVPGLPAPLGRERLGVKMRSLHVVRPSAAIARKAARLAATVFTFWI